MADSLHSHSNLSTTFPRPVTPFIGRREEITAIKNLLAEPNCRLITLVGPGGIGKTRLALAVASEAWADYAEGACFVALQAVEENKFLITGIADALKISLNGPELPETQLLNALGQRELLLVLDNFEQLIPAGGTLLLIDLLERAPNLTLLVTSREVLNLRAEWSYPVQALPVPEENEKDIEAFDAVKLFAEHARRARQDFSLVDERQAVIRVCRLVEGSPLAIVLAASWVRTLSCTEIAAEIELNKDFPATSQRDMPSRHHSMQAVFEQSWVQLSKEQQKAFRKLSIFRGSFGREAAATVCGASLGLLSALIDKSLVQREVNRRFAIHELLRQYGAQKLEEHSEEARYTHNLHCTYYTDFLHEQVPNVNGQGQRQAIVEIATEIDNVRAAWQWAVDHAKVREIQRGAGGLFYYCELRSRFMEGVDALKAAANRLEKLESSKLRDLTLAQVLNHLGWLYIRVGDFENAGLVLEKSRSLYTQRDTPPLPFMGTDSTTALAIVALIGGKHERAVELGEEARQANQARNDRQNLSFAHYVLASARLAQGDYAAAYQNAKRACTLANDLGNQWFLAYPLNEWGNVARAMGNFEEAKRHYQASYAIKKEFNDPEGMAVALNHLGEIAFLLHEYQKARQLFHQSLAIYQEINDRGGLATVLKGLGQVAGALNDLPTVIKRFREALQIAADIHYLPLICSIFIEVEILLKQQGEIFTLGVQILALVQRHPSSDYETKVRARLRLKHYQAQMAADEFAKAVGLGERWDLQEAIATLQIQLAALAEQDRNLQKPDQPLVEPLTPREMEVLRHIAAGHTNPEIAKELVISLGTAKWFASQIYGKLGVSNRTEAAARARELNLL